MNLRLSKETIRRTTAATLAAGMFVGAAMTAAPALADTKAPTALDRKAVIKRAKTWTKAKVPYSQTDYRKGYRTDCSGFVAMAWNIPENIVTWNVPLVAKRISKNQLKPGDVLLNTQRNRHVIMFEKWADTSHKSYWVLEQTGQSGVDRAIRRKMVYPYRIDAGLYKAYRYKGMASYFKAIPKGSRQPVKGYKLLDKPVVKAQSRKVQAPKPVTPKSETPAKQPTSTTPAPADNASVKPAVTPGFIGTLATWLGVR